jgi:hypothetical protein
MLGARAALWLIRGLAPVAAQGPLNLRSTPQELADHGGTVVRSCRPELK